MPCGLEEARVGWVNGALGFGLVLMMRVWAQVASLCALSLGVCPHIAYSREDEWRFSSSVRLGWGIAVETCHQLCVLADTYHLCAP